MTVGRTGTVFVLSSVHWHFTWQRHHEIATRLAAAGFTLIFIEPIPKRWPTPRELGRIWGRLTGRRQVAGGVQQTEPDGVTICSPLLFPDTNIATRAVNRWLVARLARRLLASSSARPRIVVNYLPLAASLSLQRALDPDVAIYDCVWDWPHDPHSQVGVLREDELVGEVDMVMADAPYLVERMQQAGKRVRRMLPAVDYRFWAPARRSSRTTSRPLCGYFGAIGANLDLELVRRLSRSFPLRLIGPVQISLGDLGGETEVVGPVRRERLPELLADVDVIVLPYQRGGHSDGVMPAKTFECLATGCPVIATRLPSLERFAEVITLCDDAEAFVAAVEVAGGDTPSQRDARLAAARANDWNDRIIEVLSVIDETLSEARSDG